MSAVRALMFVHQGMDVENQWEKAVAALESMSNLEIALVWRQLSESVPVDDFKMHSEYKCIFNRAVREAERRIASMEICSVSHELHHRHMDHDYHDGISDRPSINYEFDRNSDHGKLDKLNRDSSGLSGFSVHGPAYTEDEKRDIYSKYLDLILENGLYASNATRSLKDAIFLRVPQIDEMDEGSRKEYFERLINKITSDSMSTGMKEELLKRIRHSIS